ACGMVQLICFDGTFQLTLHFIGERRIAQPPAPSITGADMDPHLPRNTPGRTGKAQQKGGEYPVRQRPLPLVQQRISEVVEGALTAMAPVAFAPRAILVGAPASNMVALAARTLQRTVFPPECMDICLALFGIEELVQMGEHRHG